MLRATGIERTKATGILPYPVIPCESGSRLTELSRGSQGYGKQMLSRVTVRRGVGSFAALWWAGV
jgi:hypothetical protein